MFIQPDDFDTFRQLLGCEEVPEKYAKEYFLRLNAFHKSCGSGAIGNLAIIDLLRFCGWQPASVPHEPEEIDWDSVKKGQRVEARYNGGWLAGDFQGFGPDHVLLVKLDEYEYVKECRKHMVRLSNLPKPPPVELKDEPLPPEEASAQESSEPAIETADVFGPPQAVVPDWSIAEVGEEVWTEINDEVAECKFTKLLPDGQLVVTDLNGDDHTVPAASVTRAAMAAA